MPRIVFKKSEHPPVELSDAATVGRSEKHSNVVVKDTRLSRAHCRFEKRDDAWAIVDLGSQNGTFLNGRRVQEGMIKAGDIITIGTVDMQFEETGGPGANTVMAGVQSTRASGLDLEQADDVGSEPESSQSTRTVVAPAALVLVQGSLQDKIHPLTHDPYNIGRKHDNQLCLENDGRSSGYHARIRKDGVDYIIEDLGSTNGVVINGTRITGPVKLKTGMKVVLGSQVFKFQLHGKPNESSGQTAPKLAGTDVRKRLDEARKAERQPDDDDVDDVVDAAGIPLGEASEADLREASQTDMAALTQKVRFSGGGGALFAAAEIIMVIGVAGALLFAAWMFTTSDSGAGGDGIDSFPPVRAVGLTNPSFEMRDEGGYPSAWRYSVSGTDNFSVVEGAMGGQYALLIARFNASNRVSFAVTDPIALPLKLLTEDSGVGPVTGIRVSAYATNPEFDNGRMGTAIVQVWWFAHAKDREPILISPIAARTNLREWTELTGAALPPPEAKAFCIALGVSGTPGSVLFDEVSLLGERNPPDRIRQQQVSSATGLNWKFSENGNIDLSGPGGALLRGGRILLYAAEGREDPLDPMQTLVEPPSLTTSGNEIQGSFRYFDPVAGHDVRLLVNLGGKDAGATFSARLEQTASGDFSKAARFVALNALATPQWVPGEIVRFEPDGKYPAAYADDIGVSRAERSMFGRLLSADTGTGNLIESPGARAWAGSAVGGRELLLQNSGSLSLTFKPGQGSDELQRNLGLLSAVQPGEDQVDRVNRALKLIADFTYNQSEIAAAAEAIDAASKHYRLRLIELRDGINVPALTRNEQLYRSAMREAIDTADKLRGSATVWDDTQLTLQAELAGGGMNKRSKETARKARAALTQLKQVAEDFSELAEGARESLFMLEIEIEQRDSEPFIVSARDYLQSGQYVQGMLKLETVVQRYPRCLRGIEAKERLADVADILLKEMDDFNKQGLKNIATDRAVQARELIKLVQAHLLSVLLTEDQKKWLKNMPFSAETPPSGWLDRESALARRLQALAGRLPAGLPEE